MYQSYSGSTPRSYGPRPSPITSWQVLYRLSVTGAAAVVTTTGGAEDADGDGEKDGEEDGDGEGDGEEDGDGGGRVEATARGVLSFSAENALITPPQQHNASTPALIDTQIVCRAVSFRAGFVSLVTQ
jgi:hypothetical protein